MGELWDEYKELQQLAIQILSLACDAMGCERNGESFNLSTPKEGIDWNKYDLI